MSIIIGLTGPTGAGKSIAAQYAAKLGIKVIDCDKLSREVTQTGKPALSALKKVFGDDIIMQDGSLDRKTLAKKAFCSKENTQLLNKTVFPFIIERLREETGSPKVLLDAPTLFESGADKICDDTLVILANDNIRLKRITERDSLKTDEAVLRMSAGKDNDFYLSRSKNIIYNNGDLDEYMSQVKTAFEKLFGGK